MNKLLLMMGTALSLLFVACSNDSENQPEERGMGTVSFFINNYEQVSLNAPTRATATSLLHLDMAVYDATTSELVKSKQTTQDDNGYGSFSVTLPYGNYTIVFLGYDGSKLANLTSPTNIFYSDSYVPNFFYKTISLTVSSSESAAQSIALKRAVAAFTVRSNGDIPIELNKIKISASGGGHRFNALTGTATSIEDREYTYNVASYAGKDAIGISFFTFLGADEATMDFTVTALDESNAVIRSRDFTNVPMKINQRSIYTGSFFSADASTQGFSLTLDDDEWTETNYTY